MMFEGEWSAYRVLKWVCWGSFFTFFGIILVIVLLGLEEGALSHFLDTLGMISLGVFMITSPIWFVWWVVRLVKRYILKKEGDGERGEERFTETLESIRESRDQDKEIEYELISPQEFRYTLKAKESEQPILRKTVSMEYPKQTRYSDQVIHKESIRVIDDSTITQTYPYKKWVFNLWGAFNINEQVPSGSVFFNPCPICEKGIVALIEIPVFMGREESIVCNSCGAVAVGPFHTNPADAQYAFFFENQGDKQRYNEVFLTRMEWERIATGGMSFEEEARTYGRLPDITPKLASIPIILGKEEIIHWAGEANFYEERAVRTSYSTGGSVRVAKGVWVRSGKTISSYSHSEWKQVGTGTLFLTNKRILFAGQMRSLEHRLDKLRVLEEQDDGIILNGGRFKKNHYFVLHDPAKWNLFVRTAIQRLESVVCPQCNMTVPDHADYCPGCGIAVRVGKKKTSRRRKREMGQSIIGFSIESYARERPSKETEDEVFYLVREGKYREAYEYLHHSEPSRLFEDWSRIKPEIEAIGSITPEETGLKSIELADLKAEAITRLLFGKGFRKKPHQFWSLVYQKMFSASRKRDLQEMRASGKTHCKILAADDSCDACKALASTVFSIETVPDPQKVCSRDWCRCIYLSVVD